MADNEALIRILAKYVGTDQIKQAAQDLRNLDAAAKQAATGEKQLAAATKETELNLRGLVDSGGVAGIGIRNFREVTRSAILGIDTAFMATSGAVAKMNAELSKSIMQASQLAMAFSFVGPVGAAVTALGLGLGFILEKMAEQRAVAEQTANELAKPYIETREQLERIADLDNPLDRIAQSIPATRQQLQSLVSTNHAAAREALQFVDAQLAQAQILKKLEDAYKKVTTANQALAWVRKQDSQWVLENTAVVEAAESQYIAAIETVNQLNFQLRQQIGIEQRLGESLRDEIDASERGVAATHRQLKARERAALGADAYTAAVKKLKDELDSLFQSMVGKALTPTVVTPEDVELTRLGKYKDKWDEIARRWDVIKEKGMTGEYALQERQLFKLGMTAEEAAARFRDFSLFADLGNLSLINMTPLTEDVTRQIESMIGRFNAVKAASEQVWKDLPEHQKKALEEFGILSADDITRKALGLDTVAKVRAQLEIVGPSGEPLAALGKGEGKAGGLPLLALRAEIADTDLQAAKDKLQELKDKSIRLTLDYAGLDADIQAVRAKLDGLGTTRTVDTKLTYDNLDADLQVARTKLNDLPPTAETEARLDLGQYRIDIENALDLLLDLPETMTTEARLGTGMWDTDIREAHDKLLTELPDKRSVESLLDVSKSPEFDPHLKDILDSVPDEIDVRVNLLMGEVDSDLGAARDKGLLPYNPAGTAKPETAEDRYGNRYQEGGRGMITKSGWLYADAGERFWFSGTQNQVPPPATNVSINASVRNDLDIQRLAYRIAREIQRKQ